MYIIFIFSFTGYYFLTQADIVDVLHSNRYCVCVLQRDLEFIFATQLEDVLLAAFDDGFPNLVPRPEVISSKL